MNQLIKHRKQIDRIDRSLIRLLAKRMINVREIGKIKHKQGIKPYNPKRWKQVLDSRMKLGRERGLNQSFIKKIYNLIHDYSLSIEKNV